MRWTPAHRGVEGNEHADTVAKRAAEGREDRTHSGYLGEAGLSHLTRKTTEVRSEATRDWVRSHVRGERRYRPPPGGRIRKGLGKVRKELAGRFCQLLSSHAATVVHLKMVGQAPNDKCWWCGSGETVVSPFFHQVPSLDTRDPKAVTKSREGLRVGVPQGPLRSPPLPRQASDPGRAGIPGGHKSGQVAGSDPHGGGGKGGVRLG